MEWHQFAMTLRLPAGREAEWDRLLARTMAPHGIRCSRRSSTLLIFEVEAEMEFLAIERAESWLQEIAQQARPSLTLGTNAQPAHEIDC